jgi:tetratricopeptide (TPR) repeat protein
LFSSLLVVALPLLLASSALGQDLASAVAELKRVFEDDLLFDRLTTEKAVAALPTAQHVAANATDAETQALARRAMGEMARQLNDLPNAEAQFRAVLLLYPGSNQAVWARHGLGLVYEKEAGALARLELRRSAVSEFQALLTASPAHPVANRAAEKIGLIYLDLRDQQRAAEAYSKAIASYPGTPGAALAHGGLAQAYLQLRRWDEAIKYARLRASFTGYPRCAMFQLMAGTALKYGDRLCISNTGTGYVFRARRVGRLLVFLPLRDLSARQRRVNLWPNRLTGISYLVATCNCSICGRRPPRRQQNGRGGRPTRQPYAGRTVARTWRLLLQAIRGIIS